MSAVPKRENPQKPIAGAACIVKHNSFIAQPVEKNLFSLGEKNITFPILGGTQKRDELTPRFLLSPLPLPKRSHLNDLSPSPKVFSIFRAKQRVGLG